MSPNTQHNKTHHGQRTSAVLCGRYHAFSRPKTFTLPIKKDFFVANLCVFDVNYSNRLLVGSETRNKLWKQYQEWGVQRQQVLIKVNEFCLKADLAEQKKNSLRCCCSDGLTFAQAKRSHCFHLQGVVAHYLGQPMKRERALIYLSNACIVLEQ